ncbi:UCH-domain-containing protein [Sesbania bispinosa]|nr:UCH-domain-containing protein [Sesbania bispinosa]
MHLNKSGGGVMEKDGADVRFRRKKSIWMTNSSRRHSLVTLTISHKAKVVARGTKKVETGGRSESWQRGSNDIAQGRTLVMDL